MKITSGKAPEGQEILKQSWTMADLYTARFSSHATLSAAWEWVKTQEPMSEKMGQALFADASATTLILVDAIVSTLPPSAASERFDEWGRAMERALRGGAVALQGGSLKSLDRIFDVFLAQMLSRGAKESQGLIWRREGAPAMSSCFALARILSGGEAGDDSGQKILGRGLSSAYARAIHAPSCENIAKVRAWLMMGADACSPGFGREGFDECLGRASAWWLASNLAEFGAVPSAKCRELAGLRAVEAFRRGGWNIGHGRAQELVRAAGALFSAGGDEAKAFRSRKGASIGCLIVQEVERHGLASIAKALGENGGEMLGRAVWSEQALRSAYEQGALVEASREPSPSKSPAKRL